MFRMRTFLVIVMIFAFAGSLISALAQDGEGGPERVGFRPDAPTYGVHGPYWVGTREFVIDPEGDRPLKGTMWYPALNPEGADEAVTYYIGVADLLGDEWDTGTGRGLLDAPPDAENGPFPLVVFSTSTLATRLYTPFILEHLASWGFVVLAVEHPGSDFRAQLEAYATPEAGAQAGEKIFNALVDRAQDIRREIDFAEVLTASDGDFAGLIDLEHVIVVGNALGSHAALVTVGARIHFDTALESPCDPTDMLYGAACGLFTADTAATREAELRARAGVEGDAGAQWPSLADPRVDAVVLMLPIFTASFGTDGLSKVDAPVMIIDLGDLWTGSMHDQSLVYGRLGTSDAFRISFTNAGTGLFSDCDAKWLTTQWFSHCSDPVWDINRAQDLMDHFTTAFLLAEVKGDADARAALLPDAVTFPGIEYQTTLK